ncbi:cold shock protein 1-like [Helianthus annuus]|uniref:cold shock protein 1-like n=1 Tax=Helianthus annuus TaxID=4232 RepID=UPI001652E679|nr:cold shock protein 1-like [Helianthus annuus]
MEQFIWGLAPQALSLMTASTPPTTIDVSIMSLALAKEALRLERLSTPNEKIETQMESTGKNKRKLIAFQGGVRANNKNKAKKGKEYMGKLPKCEKCRRHHTGQCRNEKCDNCGRVGHCKEMCWRRTRRGNQGQVGSRKHGVNNDNSDYRGRNGDNQERRQGCFNYGDVGHLRKDCPREIKQDREGAFNNGACEAC